MMKRKEHSIHFSLISVLIFVISLFMTSLTQVIADCKEKIMTIEVKINAYEFKRRSFQNMKLF